MEMKIGLVGAGEMGSAVGARLRTRGARVVTVLQGRSAESAFRVARAGIEVAASLGELVDGAAFVLSIVPPGVALDVARELDPALRAAPVRPVYVDCNAVAPHTARAIAAAVAPTGAPFVDAGIVGSPPARDEGPRFYASGAAAPELARLRDYGLDVRVLDGDVGVASALKMSYAGITKGLTGIGAAMMLNATRYGVDAALRAELESSQPQLFAWLGRQVPRMSPKAYRWVAEMQEIAATAGDDAATEAIYQGFARLYAQFAAEHERSDGDGPLRELDAFVGAR